MIVRQQHILNRLISDAANTLNHALSHDRGGSRIDDHHGVIPDDDSCIRVPFGGVRPGMLRELLETYFFFFEISL